MKKLILILLFVLGLISCEEVPSETIEPGILNYTVLEITAPNFIVFSEEENSISTSVLIENSESVQNIWFNINTIDGLEEISKNNKLLSSDNSNIQTYNGKAILDNNLLTGKYEIEYYIEDNVRAVGENIYRVGTRQFQYQSEAENFPPIISDLIIPSVVEKSVAFIFSIKVSDPNGSSDIDEVYFELMRPDGSIVYLDQQNGLTKFPMFDNGDFEGAGDDKENDGIYSLKNSFGPTSQTGDWVFIFGAVDKSDSVSNTITHILKVN